MEADIEPTALTEAEVSLVQLSAHLVFGNGLGM